MNAREKALEALNAMLSLWKSVCGTQGWDWETFTEADLMLQAIAALTESRPVVSYTRDQVEFAARWFTANPLTDESLNKFIESMDEATALFGPKRIVDQDTVLVPFAEYLLGQIKFHELFEKMKALLPAPSAPSSSGDSATIEAFRLGAMESAPCFHCGYDGEGYFQPDKHDCAKYYHAMNGLGREGATVAFRKLKEAR